MSEKWKEVWKHLSRLAKGRGETPQDLLNAYIRERFLYRISLSELKNHLLLKGGLLIQNWLIKSEDGNRRPTQDIDFLRRVEKQSIAQIIELIKDSLLVEGIDDGVFFDLDTLRSTTSKQADKVHLFGFVGKSRSKIEIDVGTGDYVFPSCKLEKIYSVAPSLNNPIPEVLCYPKEAVISEKYEAIVNLSLINSRMKDFYDIWLISNAFTFDGETLSQSMLHTFSSRGTTLQRPSELFSQDYSREVGKHWNSYMARVGCEIGFVSLLDYIESFLDPITSALLGEERFRSTWIPLEGGGGKWLKRGLA